MILYDYTAKPVSSNDYSLSYGRYGTPGANYIMLRIFKTKTDGTKQYPFIYAPNGVSRSNKSTLEMNMIKNYPFAINAGVFDMTTYAPMGTLIQNGILLQQGSNTLPDWNKENQMVLTIDQNGDLSYAAYDANGSTLISSGVVSAVHSFCPIIINYENANSTIDVPYLENTADAQRQVIGQFGNGDYCIITSEGRSYQASTGLTIPQLQDLCKSIGLKFAFDLDGGGSAETVINQKQLNMIYEGTYGREVPNYIIFNGKNTFV